MASGPAHYAQAEQLMAGKAISEHRCDDACDRLHYAPTAQQMAAAQVHATLALAAATAQQDGDMTIRQCEAWRRVGAL